MCPEEIYTDFSENYRKLILIFKNLLCHPERHISHQECPGEI